MAHTCPECDFTCHCGGDIDDMNFGYPEHYCKCCGDLEEDDEDDDWYNNEIQP